MTPMASGIQYEVGNNCPKTSGRNLQSKGNLKEKAESSIYFS